MVTAIIAILAFACGALCALLVRAFITIKSSNKDAVDEFWGDNF
jgi:hypothetical protein